MMRRLLLFGPPGAGKGTQGQKLADTLGVPVASTGDVFRAHVRDATPLGRELSALIAGGDLVPDSITSAMVADRLSAPDAADGFVLDGYPRTMDQLAALDEILAELQESLDAVLLLDVPDDVLTERLLRRAAEQGRADDTPGVVQHRIDIYHHETEPLAGEYDRRGVLIRVDGTGTTAQVQRRLRTIVTAARSDLTTSDAER